MHTRQAGHLLPGLHEGQCRVADDLQGPRHQQHGRHRYDNAQVDQESTAGPASTPIGGMRVNTPPAPSRPAATAPMPTGSRAYAAPAQTLTGTDVVTRRAAKNAAIPATGMHPIMSPSTATP